MGYVKKDLITYFEFRENRQNRALFNRENVSVILFPKFIALFVCNC